MEELPSSPLDRLSWKPPKVSEVVDRRVVVNPRQARQLLVALTYVAYQRRGPFSRGQRLMALYAPHMVQRRRGSFRQKPHVHHADCQLAAKSTADAGIEVGGAVPQTAPLPVVTRRFSSGLLKSATHPPEDGQRNRNAVLRVPNGPYRGDCSSTDEDLCVGAKTQVAVRDGLPRQLHPRLGEFTAADLTTGAWARSRAVPVALDPVRGMIGCSPGPQRDGCGTVLSCLMDGNGAGSGVRSRSPRVRLEPRP
jgi:hypothetical protein